VDTRCRRFVPPVLIALLCASAAQAQVRVHPTGVNVNAQGATTVFLTFGGVQGYAPVTAEWCGDIVAATPSVGVQCAPGTVFGRLPLRFDLSRSSGTGALTDIMTIPPSVARRAYQAAADGANSAFFYVRQFRSLTGGPDVFVAVTCRLTGGGARTPLSLTDVRLVAQTDATVLQVATGERLPVVDAHITYTGTGRLVGRWEVVLPGDALPSSEDLLTEASLPLELRTEQRRYTPLARFNVFLPPTGRVVLPGPDPTRLPTTVDGAYTLLLRIEATADKEGDSNLGSAGAGSGFARSGAVAGFPMPVLRYVVGSGTRDAPDPVRTRTDFAPLSPRPEHTIEAQAPLVFRWQRFAGADVYRVEVQRRDTARTVSALQRGDTAAYEAPIWFRERLGAGPARWRVLVFDASGRQLARTAWWEFTHAAHAPE
jgi:hypothetical protein